jgi:hypothetical protein
MFLSRAQTQNFLDADVDGFIARLSPWDLEARHVRTNREYLEKSIQSAGTFTDSERAILRREARRADEFLKGTRYDGVPWRFAKASYEEGLPHTRGRIIFLPGSVDASTLVHERVHVIQKLKGPQVPLGYSLTELHYKNLRANPDTDGRVWTLNGQLADAYYKTTRPMGIQDVIQHAEHPFEAEAYAVSNAFRPNARWNT